MAGRVSSPPPAALWELRAAGCCGWTGQLMRDAGGCGSPAEDESKWGLTHRGAESRTKVAMWGR